MVDEKWNHKMKLYYNHVIRMTLCEFKIKVLTAKTFPALNRRNPRGCSNIEDEFSINYRQCRR